MLDKIILVSNGPTVLEKENGLMIDSFDKVVRFNNFETKGFESKIGSKTSVLARRCCDDVNWYNSPDLESVLCFMTYCKWSPFMGDVAYKVKEFYADKAEIIRTSTCKAYGETLGLDQPDNEWATVGILTIFHLLNKYPVLHLYGWDMNLDAHYFKRQPKDSKFHDGEKEQLYVAKLVEEGRCILI